jgi:hypothetical protein
MATKKPEAKTLALADEIAKGLFKIDTPSFFNFDKDYSSSNSVDRDFLKSLVEKDDFNSFQDKYFNV